MRRRTGVWLAGIAALLVGVALAVLWWVDPAEWPLPICTFYATTGLYCPGCGATRATHELLHGRLADALHANALWIAALPVLMCVAVWQLRAMRTDRPLGGNLAPARWFLVAAVVLALAFAILRNLPGYPFTLLAPV